MPSFDTVNLEDYTRLELEATNIYPMNDATIALNNLENMDKSKNFITTSLSKEDIQEANKIAYSIVKANVNMIYDSGNVVTNKYSLDEMNDINIVYYVKKQFMIKRALNHKSVSLTDIKNLNKMFHYNNIIIHAIKQSIYG